MTHHSPRVTLFRVCRHVRFLTEQRRLAEEKEDENLQELVEDSYTVLRQTSLEDASDIDKALDRVAAEFFRRRALRSPIASRSRI